MTGCVCLSVWMMIIYSFVWGVHRNCEKKNSKDSHCEMCVSKLKKVSENRSSDALEKKWKKEAAEDNERACKWDNQTK